MKIKKIKTLKVNSTTFKIEWKKDQWGASFDYGTSIIGIGTLNSTNEQILMKICHELQEICALEMSVRFGRPDCTTDYVFVYDHRQHDTMMDMFAGLLYQFIA